MKVGVLALQGAFREHTRILGKLRVETREVRLPSDMEDIDGLVIPGGESTTIQKLMEAYDLTEKIKSFGASGKPIFGTCAGLIVLADRIDGKRQKLLNLIDIDVRRNAYGRQLDSRETDVTGEFLGKKPFKAIFIRAPKIEKTGPKVSPLARYKEDVVLARQGNILVCAFHPELTGDTRIHRYFLDIITEKK